MGHKIRTLHDFLCVSCFLDMLIFRLNNFHCRGITTISSAYRGDTSITDYVFGGAITGGLWKCSLGLRGMAAGTLIGCVMGAVAGTASVALLKITGRDMKEIRYWQYRWKEERETMIRAGMAKQMDDEDKLPPSPRDSKKLSLDEI